MVGAAFRSREKEIEMELTGEDIAVLLESLNYSIQRVSEARGTPYSVRQQNLKRLTDVQDKLRKMRDRGAE
jgi:hypothetical protein